MNGVFKSDLENICFRSNIDFSRFSGKTIMITGAAGLIGYTLTSALLYYGTKTDNPPKIVALVRNQEKAEKKFFHQKSDNLELLTADITDDIKYDKKVDYIIHAAAQTSSKAFINRPVEVVTDAVKGMINVLKFATEKKVSSFVFLSSMEVYGTPMNDEKIDENHNTNIDTTSVRSGYPESKRLCENLCCAYSSEYNLPAKIVRLTQTFGPGVEYNDGRVFAEFARCIIEKRNIILHTKGETKRNYLYTADAATAIFTILLDGKSGEAYNAANEKTYCSIYEMAKMLTDSFVPGEIEVCVKAEDEKTFGYAPTLKMNLDVSKLKSLGWRAEVGLKDMYKNMIGSMID